MSRTKLNMSVVPAEIIVGRIFVVREVKVMLDQDLAELYGVETKQFNRTIRRNIDRFPSDFMFRLTNSEFQEFLRCQIGTSRYSHGGRRYLPYAFTEQGVAMLSSVLKSSRAIQVNIQIMRTFTRMREMLMSYTDLKKKIERMENKYDKQFKQVFEVIKQLITQEEKPKEEIGFRIRYK